jgi:DNA-binding transcriptional LysR family regulator
MGITMSPAIPEELEGIEIGHDELLVILSPRHHLAQKGGITPQELSGETLIVREPASSARVFIERVFSELGLPIRYGPEVNNNEVIKSLVASGVGFAILSSLAVAEDVRARRLFAAKLKGIDLCRPIRLIARRGQPLTPVAKTFQGLLVDFCSSMSHHLRARELVEPALRASD